MRTEHGVAHRNVSPGNLLIDENAQLKIVDFALASHSTHGGKPDDLSVGGRIFGTPAYMAPEQAAGAENIGPAADVYGLGCTLFYAATGKRLAIGDTVTEMLRWHLKEQAPRLSAIVPEARPALDALLLEMLAKDPEDRPAMRNVANV